MLGPTYVKLGQILSLRQDILPQVVTDELRNLLSDLPPVEFEIIREVVETDLGRALDEMFVSVDEIPLGSASIAQSHRALLITGRQRHSQSGQAGDPRPSLSRRRLFCGPPPVSSSGSSRGISRGG